MREFINARSERTRELMREFPWFTKFYNALGALAVLVLIVSLIVWRVDIVKEQKATEAAAIAFAEQRAAEELRIQQEKEAELAEQLALAQQQEADTILMAKFIGGINGFVENYGYSENDLRTYAECVINRVYDKKHGFPNTIEEVIRQENQWVGFSDDNQVIDQYYKIANVVVSNYYANANRPVSSDFCWVELRREGCWLKNEYSDSPYVRTWRYSA